MTLWNLFFLFAGLSLFVRGWWLPRLGRGLQEAQGFRAVGVAGQRAVVGFFGLASQLAALSAVGLLVWWWWLGHTGGSAAELAAGLARLAHWREKLTYGSALWGKIALVLTVLGATIYLRHRAQVMCGAALRRVREREFERIKNAWFDGSLPPLPPTPAIEKINRRQEEITVAILELDAAGHQLNEAGQAFLENLREEQGRLAVEVVRQEIERRIQLRLDPEDVQLPVRRGIFGRVETFFMSRGMLVNLDRTRKLLVYGALLLLLPAYLNVSVPQFDALLAGRERQLHDRQVALDEIQVRFQFEKARQEWENELARQAAANGAPIQLDARQLDAINTLAVQFETLRAGDGAWQAAKFSAASAYQLHSLVVRDRILHAAAARHPENISAHTSVVDAAGADRQMRGAVQIVEDIGAKPVPATTAGKRFAENLRDIASKGTDQIRARIVREAHSFQQTATLRDFQQSVFRHFASAVSEGDGAYFTEVAEQTPWQQRRRAHVYEQAAADRASTAYARGDDLGHASAAAATDTAVGHQSPFFVELQEQVRINAGRVNPVNDTTEAFSGRLPTVDPVVDTVGLGRASDALEELRRDLPTHAPRAFTPMADALNGYPDYFPGQLHDQERTAASEVRRRLRDNHDLAGLFGPSSEPGQPGFPTDSGNDDPHGGSSGGGGGGGGGGGRGGVAQRRSSAGSAARGSGFGEPGGGGGLVEAHAGSINKSFRGGPSFDSAAHSTGQIFRTAESAAGNALRGSESILARSRSFAGLRGFSRVGGVLIGQERTTRAITPGIEGFRWEWVADKTLCFVLRTADGRERRSIPYRTSVVQRALQYAADQRPTAATMVKAIPLEELKVLLHPTLLDTALGASIIDLDRLVDTYTGDKNGFRARANLRVKAEHALYQVAWSVRLLLAKNKDAESDETLHSYFEVATNWLGDARTLDLAALALGPGYAKASNSPLAVKSEFYELDLVAQIITLARSAGSMQEFKASAAAAWKDQASDVGTALGYYATKSSSFQKVPSSTRLAASHWITPPPEFEEWSGVRERPLEGKLEDVFTEEGKSVPMMLDFMVQVAFTSPPGFSEREIEGEYQDTQPWEFPAIAPQVRDAVLANLQPADCVILADGLEFTQVQRLFRCAFHGQLGEKFPLERLAELSTELDQKVPELPWHTPRWNARPGWLEQGGQARLTAAARELAGEAAPSRLLDRATACLQALDANRERRERFDTDLDALARTPRPTDPLWRKKWDETWSGLDRDLVKWEEDWQVLSNGMRDTARGLKNPPSAKAADKVVSTTLELTAALKMRRALKVSEDERLNREVGVGLRLKPAL